jgi:MscS family membrane protein
MLIWIYTAYKSIAAIPYEFSKNLMSQLDNASSLLIYCFIGWFLLRTIDGFHEYIKDHQLTKSKKIDKTLMSTISKVLKLIVFITIAIMVLDSLGVRVTGLITFAGIGTAAIGFASKDLFANYLCTLVIFFDKPFVVGDEIDLPEKNIIGVVEEINWRVTKLKTDDHVIVYVPNSYFYNSHIKNNSKINNGRIRFVVRIDPKAVGKLEMLTTEIRGAVFSHEFIDEECEHTSVCIDDISGFAPSILVNCSAKSNDYNFVLALKEELMIKVLKILRENKVLPAFDYTKTILPIEQS